MPRYRAIIADLMARGLPTKFNGEDVDSWKVVELKKFIRVFSHQPARTQGLGKQQLCVKLAQIKPSTVTEAESRILSGVLGGTVSIDDAHSQLTSTQTTHNNPTSGRMCELCSESKTQAEFPVTSASAVDGTDRDQEQNTKHTHENFTTCIDCLSKHIETKSLSTTFLDSIECPEHLCHALLDPSLMQHAPPAILARHTAYLSTKSHQALHPSITCANLRCQHTIPIPATDPNNPACTPTDLKCPSCSYPTCIKCGTFSHMMQDHQQNRIFHRTQTYREILAANPALATASTPTTTDNLKLCPNPTCRALLTLKGGCPNARCAACRYKFCWHCDQGIAPGGRCNHLRGKGCQVRLKRLRERWAAKTAGEGKVLGGAERGGRAGGGKGGKKTRGKEAYLGALVEGEDEGVEEDGRTEVGEGVGVGQLDLDLEDDDGDE